MVFRWVKRLLPTLFLLLAGCGSPRSFLLFLDPYYWELARGKGIEEKDLKSEFGRRGCRALLEVVAPEALSVDRFEAALRQARPRGVFLGSLFPLDLSNTAAKFKDTVFFMLEGPLPPSTGGNVVLIRFRRPEAFFKAGSLAGRLLSRADAQKWLPTPRSGPSKVGILAAADNRRAREETQAFRNGLAQTLEPARFIYRELDSLNDRAKARRQLEQMREQGVVITLLKTYTLTNFCLDFFEKEGGYAIVEDWSGLEVYEKAVLMSVEEDLFGALGRALAAIPEGGEPVAGRLIEEPARLVWGKAVPVPQELGDGE